MPTAEIKIPLHEGIEHLTEAQLKKLLTLFKETFPEKGKNMEKKEPRKLGIMPGLIEYMAPDFNEALEDFKDYMPE